MNRVEFWVNDVPYSLDVGEKDTLLDLLRERCVDGITADAGRCLAYAERSVALATMAPRSRSGAPFPAAPAAIS